MITVSTDDEGKKFKVQLSGSILNILLIGVVNFLKDRKAVRALAAIFGFICLVGGAISYITPAWVFDKIAPPLLVTGLILAFASILSGPNFVSERNRGRTTLGTKSAKSGSDHANWLILNGMMAK